MTSRSMSYNFACSIGRDTYRTLQHNHQTSYDMQDRLDAIGFVWETKEKRKRKAWDERLEDLKMYRAEHGKWPTHEEKWEGMGHWVHNQRRLYATKDRKFMTERA